MRDEIAPKVNGVETMGNYDGVLVINICTLLEHIYGPTYFDGLNFADRPSYEESGRAISKWASENGSACYAADREDFSLVTAVSWAKKTGKKVVVVEDLS